ncbi:hypothetical protein AUC70_11695 [Methyloceanibacter stevinii]|uniref:Glycoside hydrolase family 24 n=1 Tax=Methyloceanibacter stevinii TaxID=1774970 RepID=A0A1E3VJ37_9HYPH|nr:hypothetical protein [Methyloceanibacter stevinii]ODR93522.1 hypothetical protein AUC70_11695 [Methyloceanibacter stevinii]
MIPLSYPRDFLHDAPLIGLSFDPEPMAELTPLRSGKVIAKELGPTLWRASFQTDKMAPAEAGAVRAFYASLLSFHSFYAYDKMREFPLAYVDGFDGLEVGGQPFTGECTLADVPSATLVALEDLPPGFVLSKGDYLSFDYGAGNAKRALHMIVQGDAADGAGAVTVEVAPYVRTGWSAAATVSLYRASAEFIIVPGSYRAPKTPPHFTTVSFDAMQRLF